MVTRKDIEIALIQKDAVCASCGERFHIGDVRSYNHTGGTPVEGFRERQWVYMHCQKCGYDSSLNKLMRQIKHREENKHSKLDKALGRRP